MAVSATTLKTTYNVVLSVSEEKTANVSLGTIDPINADDEKAISIAGALVSCLEGTFTSFRKVSTSAIEEA